MPRYKKGIETKETILQSARKLFYINGLKSVSINTICKDADIKLGTLTYYFKKKDDLVVYFYNDYMKRINEFIKENTHDLEPAKAHIYMILIYYFNIYRDHNTVRFHGEVLENTSMYNILYNQRELIGVFADNCEMAKNEEMFELLVLADNAVRRELNLLSIVNPNKELPEIKQLITKIYTVSAQLFSFDQDLLNQYIEEGYEFLLSNLDYHIRLLL